MGFKYYLSKFFKKIQIPSVKNSRIDKKAKICSGSNVIDTTLGRYSYIGNNCTVVGCEIGNFCSIADNCNIGDMSHPLDRVTTSPVMHKGKNCLKTNFGSAEFEPTAHTVIENDVWIGDGCHIKGGVHLSTGCVIGMGSVLTKDVGAYEIWAGNPAKLIRKRFDDETIDKLLKTEWWNWPDEKISANADRFISPAELLSGEPNKP